MSKTTPAPEILDASNIERDASWPTLKEAQQLTMLKARVILNWARTGALPTRRTEKGVELYSKDRLLALAEAKSNKAVHPPSLRPVESSTGQSGNGNGRQAAADAPTEQASNLENTQPLAVLAESTVLQKPAAGADLVDHSQTSISRLAPPVVEELGGDKSISLEKGQHVRKRVAESSEQIAQSLTTEEREQLVTCEQTIRRGLGTFVAVGVALMEIRDARLYRQTHLSFETYVQSVLTLSRPRAYQLIDSAGVVQELSTIVDSSRLPQNEGQARELLRWKTAEERGAKWKSVLAAAGDHPLTAKFIRQTLCPSPKIAPIGASCDAACQINASLSKLRGLIPKGPVKGRALELIAELERLLLVQGC
jgi:hypothetical protein